jgi:predicted metal-dependent HD superfamily phosphohydrolase
MDQAALRARWDDDLAGAPPARSAAAFTDLVSRYGESHRRYHTVEHVAAVLRALDDLGDLGADGGRAVRLAGWYHDAVYDPTAPDNEARSAVLARTVLGGLGVDGPTVAGAVLVDADLAVLGADAAAYDRYAVAVRAEYGHVPDDRWRDGRAAVLASFLDRTWLFHTAAGRARWEERARANLRREHEALGRR